MAATNYNKQDIDTAASAIGAEAGKFGAVGDQVPQSVSASMFGTAASSGAVASAVTALCTALRGEYSAAENLVGGIERALDATTQNNSNTEDDNQRSFQVAPQVQQV
jgi:hypothetical protein